MTSARLLVEL
jgi:predicted Zn-dependent protease